MNGLLKNSEKGQSLITVLIMMVVMVAMLALILDGGSAYLHRRQAQNAADAGALAGITELCGSSPDSNAAYNLAWEYAVTRNGSEPDNTKTIITFPTTPEIDIQVEAQVDFPIFFARIFSDDTELPAAAVAVAECSNVTVGEGLLPLAFPCEEITPENEPFSDSLDCGVKYGDPSKNDGEFVNPGEYNWDKMVIVMDSDSASNMCYDEEENPDGELDCDIDGDGISDIYDVDNRAWLNLNGGTIETDELIKWITEDYSDVDINPYTWVGGRPGVNADIYAAVMTREGDNVLIPIIDSFCEKGLPNEECPLKFNEGNPNPPDTIIETEGTPGHLYYRIIGWGLFHVSCVYYDGDINGLEPERCPFRLEPIENGGAGLPKNLSNKTIEGYFVSGAHQGGSAGGGIDMGVYWFWLSR